MGSPSSFLAAQNHNELRTGGVAACSTLSQYALFACTGGVAACSTLSQYQLLACTGGVAVCSTLSTHSQY